MKRGWKKLGDEEFAKRLHREEVSMGKSILTEEKSIGMTVGMIKLMTTVGKNSGLSEEKARQMTLEIMSTTLLKFPKRAKEKILNKYEKYKRESPGSCLQLHPGIINVDLRHYRPKIYK